MFDVKDVCLNMAFICFGVSEHDLDGVAIDRNVMAVDESLFMFNVQKYPRLELQGK